jgi:hypothetical protein
MDTTPPLFTGDDRPVERYPVREQAVVADLSGDEDLMDFISRQPPDPDGGTFEKFQAAAAAIGASADARVARYAADDRARNAALEKEVNLLSDFDNFVTVQNIRAFYLYTKRQPAEKAVIDRYILSYLDPVKYPPSRPPYGQPYNSSQGSSMALQKKGGYKSKSKSKKYRYNKKSKTNKRRRSRSKHRYNKKT